MKTQLKLQEIFFRLKKKNEAIKDKIIRDIRDLFEKEKECYYKPVRVSDLLSINYIKYENIRHRNKTLSVEEYLIKIIPCLKNLIRGKFN